MGVFVTFTNLSTKTRPSFDVRGAAAFTERPWPDAGDVAGGSEEEEFRPGTLF